MSKSTRPDPSKMVSNMVSARKSPDAASRLSLLAETAPASEAPPAQQVSAAIVPSAGAKAVAGGDTSSTATALSVGQVVEVNVTELIEGPYNPRHFYRESREQEIGESLKEHGQQVDLNVYVNDRGQLVIDDGRYRFRGAKRLGIKTLRCKVVAEPKSALTAYLSSREINIRRNEQTILDDAFMLRELIRLGEDKAEVARQMKYDASDVTRLLAISELPEQIVLTVIREPSLLTNRFLYNLALYRTATNDSEALRLANEAVQVGMSARDLESRIRKAKQGKRGRPRATRIEISEGTATGVVKSFQTGRIALDLQGLSPEQQDLVVSRLRKILVL